MTLLLLLACGHPPEEAAVDSDGDGYAVSEDCDDTRADVHPGALETCNALDDNCDGGVDEGLAATWYIDADGDAFGAEPLTTCDPPEGAVSAGGDCDDTRADAFPGAAEQCNGLDDDCNGVADEVPPTWYADADGDGYGDSAVADVACAPPPGTVADATDCDDTDPTVNPGAAELCDGDDDNCDGRADLGEVDTWHTDTDGDGYGHPAQYESTCDPEPGTVLDGTDCRPADPEAHPGAAERCNGDDDNCDGTVDEGMDSDGDGHRRAECSDGDDCDDLDPTIYPEAEERCADAVDQDCDGADAPCGFDGEYTLGDEYVSYLGDASAYLGMKVDGGDVDADGRADALLPALFARGGDGGAYLYAGGGFAGQVAPGDATARLFGSTRVTGACGRSSGVADADGDGLDDIAVGCPYGVTPGVWLMVSPLTGDHELDGEGTSFTDTMSTYAGHGSDLADVTGDGYADVVVGAYNYSGGGTGSGGVFVDYGPPEGGNTNLQEASDAVLVGGGRGDYAGRWVDAGADINGDGVGDILAAGPYGSPNGTTSGGAYLVYGPPVGVIDLAAADGIYLGSMAGALAGTAVAAGDVDGDGLSDVAVGAPGAATTGVYFFAGPAAGTFDLSGATTSVTDGGGASSLGDAIALGDTDGDGVDDVALGDPNNSDNGAQAGACWFLFGPLTGGYTEADADAVVYGANRSEMVGYSVGLLDIGGGGRADMIVGAYGDTRGGASAGSVLGWLAVE